MEQPIAYLLKEEKLKSTSFKDYLHPSDVVNEIDTALMTPVAAVTLFLDDTVTL